MKIISFEQESGVSMDTETTKFIAYRLLFDTDDIRMSYMYLGMEDNIPFHEAQTDQLFMIVSGEGWVCGEEENKIPLTAGKAAFWEKGALHATGTDSQMIVLCVEGKHLNTENMPILKNVVTGYY